MTSPFCAASTDIKEVPNEVAIGTDPTNAAYLGRLLLPWIMSGMVFVWYDMHSRTVSAPAKAF